jgi:hypothetical protein
LEGDVGDIRYPHLVRTRDGQIFEEIGVYPAMMVAVRGTNPAALGFSD